MCVRVRAKKLFYDFIPGSTVLSAKTVDFPLLHSLANISVMQ